MTQAEARHAEREAHLCNKLFAAYRAYPLQASEGARQVSLELVEMLATLRFSTEPHAFSSPCSSTHERVYVKQGFQEPALVTMCIVMLTV